jgi:hypothetical protein
MFQCELSNSTITFYANGTLVQRWPYPFGEGLGKEERVEYWKLENGVVMITTSPNLDAWGRAVPKLQTAYEAWRAKTEAEVNKEIVS